MIGPNLPKNIKMMIVILLPTSNAGVKPDDNPTVPKAEKTSKIMFSLVASGFPCSNDATRINPTTIVSNDKKTKDIAFRILVLVYSRLKAVILFPCKNLTKHKAMMKTVVVLIPPAVEIGEPPININKQLIILPAMDKLFSSKLAKPAVLNVTLWKTASKVSMLPFITSVNVKITNPETSKMPVVIKTILTKEFHCFGFFLRIIKSMIVINEIPPRMINIMMYEHK